MTPPWDHWICRESIHKITVMFSFFKIWNGTTRRPQPYLIPYDKYLHRIVLGVVTFLYIDVIVDTLRANKLGRYQYCCHGSLLSFLFFFCPPSLLAENSPLIQYIEVGFSSTRQSSQVYHTTILHHGQVSSGTCKTQVCYH